MKHNHRFLLDTEHEVASIETEGAMPHIAVGVHIDLIAEGYQQPPQTHLLVEEITVILHQMSGKVVRNDVMVKCSEAPGRASW
jgi:hypothetical protein